MKQRINKQPVYTRSLGHRLHFMLTLPSLLCFSEMWLPDHNARLGFLCRFDPEVLPSFLHLHELLGLPQMRHAFPHLAWVPVPPSAWRNFSHLPLSLWCRLFAGKIPLSLKWMVIVLLNTYYNQLKAGSQVSLPFSELKSDLWSSGITFSMFLCLGDPKSSLSH